MVTSQGISCDESLTKVMTKLNKRSFNNTADPGVHTGLSQNDAETIATADEKGPSSPKNISQHYR